MKLETKYDLNQKVWLIRLQKERKFIECTACYGSGKVTLGDDKSRTCPVCYGNRGNYRYLDNKWQLISEMTIGQIQHKIENIKSDGLFDNIGEYKEGNTKEEIKYMAYETGVGSGTLYDEENLFPSIEEAEKECEIRNEKMVK
jgi:hypothetical protein